jgi:predicted porin
VQARAPLFRTGIFRGNRAVHKLTFVVAAPSERAGDAPTYIDQSRNLMKKAIALAVLASVSAFSHAQSNVTLFGVIDVAARYTKNGDQNVKSLASNGLQTSRLGVRGVEDLGGGLKAGFWLETGLNPDTGTESDSSRFWNRRSTVSLMGGFGELRLGRDLTPSYTGYADYDAFGTNGVADAGKFVSKLDTNVDTTVRADNLVSYFVPRGFGGLYGQLSLAAGEGTGGKKYYGGRLGYAAGPLDVSVSYGLTEVTPLAGTREDEYKFGSIGASYDLKMVKVMGYVSQARYAYAKQTMVNIGATVPVGQGTLRVSYIDANASGRTTTGASIEHNDASQIAVGYVYDLSKRTALYTTLARVDNDNAANFVVDRNPALASPNNGKDSTGFEVGIRHRF